MRLCCAAIVANESDIIEAFARHTLSFVDHLHIMFHNSYDPSQLIVQRLVEEGLSISTQASADPAFRREPLGCELIRTAAGIDRFDYMLPLDADEFIVADSRIALEAELTAAPADGALSVAWLSYVPTCDDNLADPNPLTRIRMRTPAPHPAIRKVFFRADVITRFDDVILADGNHQLLSTKGRPLPERRSVEVRLAHYPVRSPDQLASKAVLGAVARQISPDFTDQSRHWRSLVGDSDIVEHRTWERVYQVARSYLGETDASPLTKAPLATPVQELRYAELISVDPFARLARCIAAVAGTGALRPIDAIAEDAGLTVASPQDENKALLAEVDVSRRMIQHLHSEIAARDAVIGKQQVPAQKPPPLATGPSAVPRRSSTFVAASDRADKEKGEIQIDLEAPVPLNSDLIISARINGVGEQSRQIWYRIPAERAPDELTIAHAFTISLINIAMAHGSDLRIDGPLSRGLLVNLEEYQAAWSRWMPDRFQQVRIRPREILPDEPFRPERGFVVPFSGGLDSMHSAWMLKKQGQLGALTSIHGLDIPLAETGMWSHTLERLRRCAQSIDVPLYPIATNWETLARELPGYLGFFLPVLAAGVLAGRGYGAIISSSSYPYDHLALPLETNPITDPLLGRPSLPVLHWGAAAHRIDKVAAIADWPEALERLRPCDASLSDGRACGRCRKCIQTAVAFLGLGLPVPAALGSRPPAIADIDSFEMTPYARLGLQDAADSARRLGIAGEWIDAVERRCIEPARITNSDVVDAAAVANLAGVAGEMRLRLDYVLGGMHRPAHIRRLRQTLRALRGMTGPRDLAPLATELPVLPEVPIAPAAGAGMVQTENGRLIYVDPTDMRGAALVEAKGNLKPKAMAMWRKLVAERLWTHIVDVGANYGEMLIGIDVPDGASLIAVEPNPHVGWHLERTVERAGLNVEVVRRAITDGARTVDLTLNRTWSGMTAISIDRMNTVGHRMEPIRVDAITLTELLRSEIDRAAMAVLIKIDVEGHEVSALKGLAGIERDFGAFAALVEITQLTAEDLGWLCNRYSIDVLETTSGQLRPAPIGSASELSQFLLQGDHHVNDVVLRRKQGP